MLLSNSVLPIGWRSNKLSRLQQHYSFLLTARDKKAQLRAVLFLFQMMHGAHAGAV